MAQGKEARNKRRREHYQEHKDKFDKTAINKKRRERRLKNGNADNKAYYKKHRAKLLERAKAYAQTPHGRYLDYKKGAIRRGYIFGLTEEKFLEYWQQPCFYCGISIETIGLDRMDNSRGYEEDNIVPCCPTCNRIKKTQSFDEFMEYCLRIAKRWNKN